MRDVGLERLSWERYLNAPVNPQRFVAYCAAFCEAFREQRTLIDTLVRQYRPKRLTCFGSGFLVDLPLDAILEGDPELFLIDWLPEVSVEGLRGHIIRQHHDTFSCLLCQRDDPGRYCCNYGAPHTGDSEVCDAFIPMKAPALFCQNYVPSREPRMVTHDATAGVASTFARYAFDLMPRCRTPKDAFRKATQRCHHLPTSPHPIPVESDSMDMVTSSMLVSQFDNEPYGYFARLLETRFGRDRLLAQEHDLLPLMETLRSTLFCKQMEAHAREMYRLVNKRHGVAYFSVELFRTLPQSDDYFIVREIPTALEILGRSFWFDFRTIQPSAVLNRAHIGNGTSIMQCYVLRPHTS